MLYEVITVDKAIGKKPKAATVAVIKTGRSRAPQAVLRRALRRDREGAPGSYNFV